MSPFCYRCSTGGGWRWGWRKRARATGQAQALQLSPGHRLSLFLRGWWWRGGGGAGWGERLAALTHIPATQTSSSALPDFKSLHWPAWFGDTRESHHFHTNDFYFDFLKTLLLAAPLPTANWPCSSALPASLSDNPPLPWLQTPPIFLCISSFSIKRKTNWWKIGQWVWANLPKLVWPSSTQTLLGGLAFWSKKFGVGVNYSPTFLLSLCEVSQP